MIRSKLMKQYSLRQAHGQPSLKRHPTLCSQHRLGSVVIPAADEAQDSAAVNMVSRGRQKSRGQLGWVRTFLLVSSPAEQIRAAWQMLYETYYVKRYSRNRPSSTGDRLIPGMLTGAASERFFLDGSEPARCSYVDRVKICTAYNMSPLRICTISAYDIWFVAGEWQYHL